MNKLGLRDSIEHGVRWIAPARVGDFELGLPTAHAAGPLGGKLVGDDDGWTASTVDNFRYGSGNKVLHNVVSGHLCAFEGNGGDLRIGLPMQSLHDGERWVHAPLRLSVFIEAPRAAIEGVLRKHEKVRAPVDNE